MTPPHPNLNDNLTISRATFVETDVSSWDSQVAAFAHCAASSPTKSVDIVISCAGVNGPSFLQHITHEDPDTPPPAPSTAALDVNLKGAYFTTCLATWYFRHKASHSPTTNTPGCLVLVASDVAYHSIPLYSLYTASKAGVRGFWRTIRESPEFTHMRCNLLAPHIVRSPMTAALQPMLDEKGVKMVEMSEVAEAAMRLVCDEGINGRAVRINPGGSVFDLGDDEEGSDGAKAMYEHDVETKGVFEFMSGLLKGQ